MSSWDPGWFILDRRVTSWDQHPRGDTQHSWNYALAVHLENWVARARKVHKTHGPAGTVSLPNTCSPECLGPRKGTKHTAHLGLCPCRALESQKCIHLRSVQNSEPTWDSALAEHLITWVAWWTVALGCGNPSMDHTLWTPLTHANSICVQCPYLSTVQLSKWAWINGHLCPFTSRQRLNSEETCKQRKSK